MKLKIPISIAPMLILPLATALFLGSLLLAIGIACGGDDNDDRRSSRSEDRESSRDSAREEQGNGEDDEAQEERADDDRDSSRRSLLERSGSSGADRSGGGVSVRNLEAVPNIPFARVAMVDIKALASGEVPREVATAYGVSDAWLALTEALGSSEDAPIEMSMEDLDTFIFLEAFDFPPAFTILGDYSLEAIRNSLMASGDGERIEGGNAEPEVWQFTDLYDTQTVIISQNQVYGIDGDLDESREFVDQVAQGDTLLGESDSPIVRLTNIVGPGWLVVAIIDWCKPYRFDGCLGMAFAASTESETSVAATFALLFDSRGAATEVHREIEELREQMIEEGRSSGFPPLFQTTEDHWITEMDTDGEFLVVEASLPVEDAREFFRELITELEHPDP